MYYVYMCIWHGSKRATAKYKNETFSCPGSNNFENKTVYLTTYTQVK